MSEGITAITYCNNEEYNIEPLYESIKDVDEWIVVDHLSTDKTAKLAKKFGARVISQGNVVDEVTKEDVSEFELRYGFLPTFKEGNKVPNWYVELNKLRLLSTNDWILWIDADERLEWDKESIKSLLPDHDAISFEFKNPNESFTCVKLARRSKTWWGCRIHSALTGFNVRTIHTDKMKLIHKQRVRDYRGGYLPTLEYAMLKEEDSRSNFYLAREYYNYQEFDKSIPFFIRYLKSAYDKTEITKSYIIMATMYYRKGMEEEAFGCIFNALRTNPRDKEALTLMTEMVRPGDSSVWRGFIKTI
jgi:glycosyltransferase involved in cell wall biosynthesis